MNEKKKKSYWKPKYNETRKSNLPVLSFRASEDEAMWIYGNASNEGIEVSEYLRRIVLADYYKDLPEESNEANGRY